MGLIRMAEKRGRWKFKHTFKSSLVMNDNDGDENIPDDSGGEDGSLIC